MRLGIFLGDFTGVTDMDGMLRQIVSVEDDGYDAAWLGQIFGPDALTLIALAGQRTGRIELCTSVVPTYPRHPFVMAQQTLTAQSATRGRLVLGIGLSHQIVIENMWGLSYEHPAHHMREYLSVLLPLIREGKVGFQGEVFRVSGALQVPGATPFPVLLAALAPAMLRMAGETADGTITWMTGVKTIATHIVPRITAAAEAAGRPHPRIVVGLPVAVTEDPAGARERAGQAFALYGQLPSYRRMLDIEGAAGPADVAIVGNEDEVEAEIRAFAAAGATDFAAAVFPAGGDPAMSVGRTRALLKTLAGRL
ncbi:MAG: TIGR03564 family F420-dependent LLM class oxidoreductase [Dehalococcoidia bacterium]